MQSTNKKDRFDPRPDDRNKQVAEKPTENGNESQQPSGNLLGELWLFLQRTTVSELHVGVLLMLEEGAIQCVTEVIPGQPVVFMAGDVSNAVSDYVESVKHRIHRVLLSLVLEKMICFRMDFSPLSGRPALRFYALPTVPVDGENYPGDERGTGQIDCSRADRSDLHSQRD